MNTADPEVFMLYEPNIGASCSATLIGSRTLLTAAHCVDPRVYGASKIHLLATNHTRGFASPSAVVREVVEARVHPDWNPFATGTLDGDIALALLSAPPVGVTPKPWNSTSINGYSGKPIRVTGFGLTGTGASDTSGTKRVVDLKIVHVEPRFFFLGDPQAGKGICKGDSGGPSFHTFSDGVERVVGVHSFNIDEDCELGGDVRVDAYAPFIQKWMSEREDARCDQDQKCVPGCTPVDLDCVCIANGVCDPECPDLSQDPDCPIDCAANGVCAVEECPRPDTDCVSDGASCENDLVCPSRQCVDDVREGARYCTRVCTRTTDCAAGMFCDPESKTCRYPVIEAGGVCDGPEARCARGTVCTGAPNSVATCQRTCSVSADCDNGGTCEPGLHGARFCNPPPPSSASYTPVAYVEQPAAEKIGCTTGAGAPLAWLLPMLFAGRLLRRRGERRSGSRAR